MAETNLGRVAIVPKGTYSASVQYYYLDLVYYNGSSYVVHTEPSIGTVPTNTSYWYLVAEGAEVEMRYDSVTDYIQWKLITDTTWNNLIQPADFTPTIVQTTGTSTTDVMSQNAVSNEIDSIRLKTNNLYKLENRISGKYIISATGVQTDNAAFSFFRVDVTPEAYYFMENDLSATSQEGAYFDINNNYLSPILSLYGHTATIDKKGLQ